MAVESFKNFQICPKLRRYFILRQIMMAYFCFQNATQTVLASLKYLKMRHM